MVRRRRKRGAAVEMGQHCRGNDSLVVEPRARIVVVAIAITKGQSWSMVESSGAWDWWRLSLPASPCLPHSALPTAWRRPGRLRSEEHTSELQSLMRHSYAVFCL